MHSLDVEKLLDYDEARTTAYIYQQNVKKAQAQRDFADTAKFQQRMDKIFEPSKSIQKGLQVS